KNLIDVTVLGFLNENGISAHITPLKINEKDNLLSKSYAHTRNFVTESINTGKVLYTLYKNPTVLNTAIKAAETANTAKNLFNGFLSFFK
ncbi:IgG-binding protein SBI, partial [Staphylococcus pseudintermedius]|nr:IgG-binding protein SBI [Staphylococcus pseudintermedius]